MIQIIKISFLAAVLFILILSGRTNAAGESIVNFRLVCKDQGADCFKANVKDSNKVVFVKNVPILTVMDIKSVSPEGYNISPRGEEFLKSNGYKGEIPKRAYRLLLRFNDPAILGRITSLNVGQTLAIFINGDLIMTPYIREPFIGDKMKVSGGSFFTEQTAQSLSDEINRAIEAKK